MRLAVRYQLCVLLCSISYPAVSRAQVFVAPPQSPSDELVDENGFDLLALKYVSPPHKVSIGASESELTFSRIISSDGKYRDSINGSIIVSGTSYNVSYGNRSETFTLAGSLYTPAKQFGSTLTKSGSTWLYTLSDGTVVKFKVVAEVTNFGENSSPAVYEVVYPDGRTDTYNYWVVTVNKVPASAGTTTMGRVQSITSTTGYSLRFEYQPVGPLPTSTPLVTTAAFPWMDLRRVTAYNMAVDYCDPLAVECSFSRVWPFLKLSVIWSVENAAQQKTEYVFDEAYGIGKLVSIRYPDASTTNMTFSLGYPVSITKLGVTTTYTWSNSGNVRTLVTQKSGAPSSTYVIDVAKGVLISKKNQLNKLTSFAYDASGRLTRVTEPEGNYVQYAYDSRGNITETRKVAKSAGNPGDIVATSSYDVSCGNAKTCNKPNWTIDALGNQTDYTYSASHGGVLTETKPAPVAGGDRPQVRYTYNTGQAYYNQGSGIVASGKPTYRLTGTSTCLVGASCVGGVSEARTAIAYGPQVAGTGNNLLPITVTNSAGNNSITAATTMAYDAVGNLSSMDGPLSGAGDKTVYRYDDLRRITGIVGPDPDDTGARVPTARRIGYDAYGYRASEEVGTVTDQSEAAWLNFSPAYREYLLNDALGRPLRKAIAANGADYSVEDYVYDSLGRLKCSVTHMNPANWGGQATTCAPLQATGAYGADRVTEYTYDAADRMSSRAVGVGTSSVATEAVAYTDNGQTSYVIDANSNRTTYEYDGHDRLVKTRYPITAKGSNASSTTDYEQLIYGDNVRVTQRRLRDGIVLNYNYDNLGRVTALGGSSIPERTYSYNLLGMQTGATLTTDAQSVTNAFDAFGRITGQTTPQGTVSYQYDAASRRTRITWPDSFYVTYAYDVAGNVTAIRESGVTTGVQVLASYSYDNLGRRTGIAYGNGTSRSYAYDAVNRLAGLRIDPAGTANDLVIGAVAGTGSPIAYNPASQIANVAKSNDAYTWTGYYNLVRSYTTNGLNQYTASGATNLGYDARGNLTSSGSTSYAYNGLNQLTSVIGGNSAAIAYDPADRLYQLISGGVTTRYLYDGVNMIGEYNGSNALLRRFVPGPATDEPVLWYEGSGTTSRRWLQADERGSVVTVTDGAGNAVALNRYDEYGIPRSGNQGRYQYTGQVWLGEAGLYYYKARFYSPTLGRFMQTDPIGYSDGMNWYNYVGGDPINGIDPDGTDGDVVGPPIVVTGTRPGSISVGGSGSIAAGELFAGLSRGPKPIVNSDLRAKPQENKATHIICEGKALVYAGNPRHVGRTGGMLRPIRPGAAAIIPRQWTGSRTAGPVLRDEGAKVGGITGGGQRFSGLDDTAGNTDLGPDPQAVLMERANGALYIELVTGNHEGATTVTLAIRKDSGLSCPSGTTQTGTR